MPVTADAEPPAALVPPAPLPRVLVTRPSAGYAHPTSKAEIKRVLHLLGPAYTYGLRLIALVRRPSSAGRAGCAGNGLLRFASLRVPGAVLLYEQRPSPWLLAGHLPADAVERFRRAGAEITLAGAGLQTVVAWPAATLRDFMLLDALLHELGHHYLQHHTGKRLARVARTRDHERYAGLFAQRARLFVEMQDWRQPG